MLYCSFVTVYYLSFMNAIQQTALRFREVFLNGTWIANTNYKDQLQGMDLATATADAGTSNTIAVLAQHIHYYVKGVKQVLEGGTLDISDKYSFDFPPMLSQAAWDDFLQGFWQDAEAFAVLIEQLSEEQLQQPFVDEKYGNYQRNIDCMIEHAYYHLGQIVLIRKMLHS